MRHTNEHVVGVAGDWHGNAKWVDYAMCALKRQFPEIGTVLHLGDFGFSRGRPGEEFLQNVESSCRERGVERLLVTPGNHDDWGMLDALFAERPGEAVQLNEVVWALPRGYRFRVGPIAFMSFGGAASIDFQFREVHRNWWPTELPTEAEVIAAASAGAVDVLLTHETINGGTDASERIILDNPWGWDLEALTYSALSRERVTRLWSGLRPALLVHGHMHVADQRVLDDGRRIYSLARDGHSKNVAILDVGTLAWTWLELEDPPVAVRRTRDIEGIYLTRPSD